MNNLLTHYPVNWIDGMKLSSSHFIAVQDFVTDSIRDVIALQTTDLNYGLQPMAGDSVKMHVLMDHYNQLQLTLKSATPLLLMEYVYKSVPHKKDKP